MIQYMIISPITTSFAISAWPLRWKQGVSYRIWGERGHIWWRTEPHCFLHFLAHRRPSSVFSSHPLSDQGDQSWIPRSHRGKEDLLWLKTRICCTNLCTVDPCTTQDWIEQVYYMQIFKNKYVEHWKCIFSSICLLMFFSPFSLLYTKYSI